MVTIIIPVYNFSDFLVEAMESCLGQSVEKEIIVIDDCSTEPINKNALSFIEAHDFIKLHRNETNRGLAGSRNVGFELAKYDWILPLDSDDFLLGESLDKMVDQIDNEHDVIYGNMFEGSLNGFVKPKINFTINDFQIDNPIFGCSLVRKSAWKKVGGYTERTDYKVHYEDYNFWAKLFAVESKFKYIDVIVYHHRYRETSMSENMKMDEGLFRDLAIEGIFPQYEAAICAVVSEDDYKYVEPYYRSLAKFCMFKFRLIIFTDKKDESDKWKIYSLNDPAPVDEKYEGCCKVVAVDIKNCVIQPISRSAF